MSEHDRQPGLFGNRLLSGWGRVFGKKQDNETDSNPVQHQQKPKPFPANHFFSREELLFLSKNQEQCTLLQRWALGMSLWAKERSDEKKRNDPQFFPYVQWQDGLMSTWIGNKAIPDDIDKQADRLYQLQLEGYEMSADFVRMIEARACRSLVSCLFMAESPADKNEKTRKKFIWVSSVVDKPGEDLALVVRHYNKVSHHHVSEATVPYKQFKKLIDSKELTALGNEAQRKWNEQATERDKAEHLFKDLLALMKRNNTCQGMFPANNTLVIRFEDGKDNVPVAWSLADDRIRLDFDPNVSIARSSFFVTADESYLFVDVLDYIRRTLDEKDNNRDLLAFVRIFGKDFCGEKVLSSGKQPFGTFGGVHVNCVTAKASDAVVAFNSATLETMSLSLDDRKALLKAILCHADQVLSELKADFQQAPDAATKETLQNRIKGIYQGLSAYNTAHQLPTLEALWQHILSKYEVPWSQPKQAEMPRPTIPQPAVGTPTAKVETINEQPTPSVAESTTEKVEETEKEANANKPPTPEPVPVKAEDTKEPPSANSSEDTSAEHLPEGYIQVEPSSKGRWHTPAMILREAYRVFGKLLSAKLKRQLENENDPWVPKSMMLPRDCDGKTYTGVNAIMLALWMEECGFELPYFVTEDEARAKELGILQDAESLFVLGKDGAIRVYNIAQTTFPVVQRRSYESLKLNMIAMERKKTSGYQFLDADSFCKTALQFDSVPGLSIYSHADKVIHIAPKDRFANEDDYYRDLAVAMVESTREVDFDTLRLDTYLFENLVSHLGSGIISQSCRFNATNPEYSHIWRERLVNNPEYTKKILEQSDTSSVQVLNTTLA